MRDDLNQEYYFMCLEKNSETFEIFISRENEKGT